MTTNNEQQPARMPVSLLTPQLWQQECLVKSAECIGTNDFESWRVQARRFEALGFALTEYMNKIAELEAKLATATETHTDENGIVWNVPTAWAYMSACKALNAKTNIIASVRALIS